MRGRLGPLSKVEAATSTDVKGVFMRGFVWGGAGGAGAIVLPTLVFFFLNAVWPPRVAWQWFGEAALGLAAGAFLQWALLRLYHHMFDARDT